MDKQLLIELELYVEKYKVQDIIKEKDIACDYMTMPKKDATRHDKGDLYFESYLLEESELENYINNERSRETFSTKLLKYIDKSELSDAEIYKKAGIDRRHFSKIRCDKYYQPKKVTAIALCIALELRLDEAEELLGIAGYSLTNSDTGDLVVKFCIERGIYSFTAINEALHYFGQKLLGVLD